VRTSCAIRLQVFNRKRQQSLAMLRSRLAKEAVRERDERSRAA